MKSLLDKGWFSHRICRYTLAFLHPSGYLKLKNITAILLCLSILISPFLAFPNPSLASAGTTSVTITKYDAHGNVIGTPLTVTWEQMRDGYMNMPVYGDGVTHYYCEGPNFNEARTFDTLWDPTEGPEDPKVGNINSRDYGAAKGTDVKDLCNLVGGATPGDTITIKATDGFTKVWDYENVYNPDPRMGRLILTWYTKDAQETETGYVSDNYSTGMRLLFFTNVTDSSNPPRHVFGDYDEYLTMPENRWYCYYDGQYWPTTSGLSAKWVSYIDIRQPKMVSCDSSGNTKESFAPGETVYVKGLGLTATTGYKIWLQPEPAVWFSQAKGDTVPGFTVPAPMNSANDPSGSQESVTTNASSDFSPIAIWTIPSSATSQKYDIVADNQAAGTIGTFDTNDGCDNPGFQGFTVTVTAILPTASFASNVQSGTAPLTVYFTDQSTGSPTSWAWDFDNNEVTDNTTQNSTYIYTTAGTYTVKLTVTNATGSDDEVKTNYITVNTAVSQPVWDLNGDHVCNVSDLVTIGLQWGETGTAGWIKEDVNEDGAINVGDVVTVGLHWGETW